MKRRLLIPFLLLLIFAAGWATSLVVTHGKFRFSGTYEIARYEESVKDLRQHIYGENHLHHTDLFPDEKAKLDAFDPAESKSTITLSYHGFRDTNQLELQGDGRLYSVTEGIHQLVTILSPEQCKAFFHQILTSGILNYSEDVIELKKDLPFIATFVPGSSHSLTEIQIYVPELGVEKSISINSPEDELEYNPDIIEYQLFNQTAQQIRDLVPSHVPLWK